MCQKYKVCVILTVNVFIVTSSIFCLEHVTMLHVTLDMMQPIVMKLSLVKTCSELYIMQWCEFIWGRALWIWNGWNCGTKSRINWVSSQFSRNYWIFHSIFEIETALYLHSWEHSSKNIQISTEQNGLQFLLSFDLVLLFCNLTALPKYFSKMCVLNFVTSLWQQLEYLIPISSNVIRTCLSRAECISSVPNEVITADKHNITMP